MSHIREEYGNILLSVITDRRPIDFGPLVGTAFWSTMLGIQNSFADEEKGLCEVLIARKDLFEMNARSPLGYVQPKEIVGLERFQEYWDKVPGVGVYVPLGVVDQIRSVLRSRPIERS